MILHCSKKLAVKLSDVSSAPFEETSPLGSWHAHLHHIDRRQCVFFCHDATRYVLFLPGLRKEQFQELGRWHKELFTACLAYQGIPDTQVRRGGVGAGAGTLRHGHGSLGAEFHARGDVGLAGAH